MRVVPLMNKDSLEMTADDRAGLVSVMGPLLPEGHPIVITHGTDTMVETGICIQRAFPRLNVPVILTGAMTPLGFEGSDGQQNLAESLHLSGRNDSRPRRQSRAQFGNRMPRVRSFAVVPSRLPSCISSISFSRAVPLSGRFSRADRLQSNGEIASTSSRAR